MPFLHPHALLERRVHARVHMDNETLHFAHYEVRRRADGTPLELGRGAMGVTYKAYDSQLRVEVALKVINPAQVDHAKAKALFLREARAAARVNHSNVAHVVFLNQDPANPFYAMEFIAGESLRDWLRSRCPVEPLLAIGLAEQITLGLEAIHSENVVHRDLKPSNVMIIRTSRGREKSASEADPATWQVKIIDFGLARAFAGDALSSNLDALTTGFRGTAVYASPEQCQERADLDGRSDLYSLGCILWEMLIGAPPFRGSSLHELLMFHVSRPAPVAQLSRLPASLQAVVARLLVKDPEGRFANAAAVVKALERCRERIESGAEAEDGTAPESELATAVAEEEPASTHRTGEPISAPVGEGKTAPSSGPRRGWRLPIAVAMVVFALTAVVGNYAGWFRISPGAGAGETPTDSPMVAILPFDAADASKENVELADGLTGEVINRVSRVPSLRVISRGAVRAYKTAPGSSARKRIRDIGTELGGIRAVLESSVQRVGDKLKIDAILYDAKTERRLWGATYDRESRDVFAIQTEIAEQIALALRVRMSAAQRERLARSGTDSSSAYDLYVKAGEPDANTQSLLEQAIALDPLFADAYAGLAQNHYSSVFDNSTLSLTEKGEKLKQAEGLARKAIQIDSQCTQAMIILSRIVRDGGSVDEGRSLIQRALQIAPNDLSVNQWAAEVAWFEGRYDESYAYARRVNILAPGERDFVFLLYNSAYELGLVDLSDHWMARLRDLTTDPSLRELLACRKLILNRDYPTALARLRLLPDESIQLGPSDDLAPWELIRWCLFSSGDWEATLADCDTRLAKDDGALNFAAYRTIVLLHLGRGDEARRAAARLLLSLEELVADFKATGGGRPRFTYFRMAIALEVLGRQEESVAQLDNFIQTKPTVAVFFAPDDPCGLWVFKDNPAAQGRLDQLKSRYELMAKRIVEIEKSFDHLGVAPKR